MTTQGTSVLFAVLAAVGCAGAAIPISLVTGDVRGALLTTLPPLLLAATGVAGTLLQIRPLLRISTGSLWRYLVLTLWSVGPYFAPAALAIAAAAGSFAGTPSTHGQFAAVKWGLLGATGICALAVLSAKLQDYRVVTAESVSYHHIDVAPVLAGGAIIFGVLLVGIALSYSIRQLRTRK